MATAVSTPRPDKAGIPASEGEPTIVHLDLPPDGSAARQARHTTRDTLLRWKLPGLVDDLLLAVSELVGNALRHAKPPFALTLRRHTAHIRVDVQDADPTPPAGVAADDERESGRGLLIVNALATEVGVEQIPDDGKTVYARFDEPERHRPI
jgi:anti-sigma regulatory factor (Ser/Thr protein kinase)